MSNKSLYIKVIIESYLNSFLFVLIGTFTSLKLFHSLSLQVQLIFSVLCAFFSVAVYTFICSKEATKKGQIRITFIGIPLFLMFTVLNFCAYMILVPHLLIDELNSANGIYIIFSMGAYVVLSFFLRLVVLIVFMSKKDRD